MRKAIGIAVLAALILSFSGCANTENAHTTESSSQKTVSAEIIQSTEPEESSAASVSESKESSGKSTPSAKVEILPPAAAESSEVESQTSPIHQPTPQPQSATPSAEETPKSEPPQETTPPIVEESEAPIFQIQTWIDFAVGYAESVVLNVSPDATDCWDNPIAAGSHSLYLERDIQSRLNRYSRDEEITDVWIWAEERSDGSYDLYIGYA